MPTRMVDECSKYKRINPNCKEIQVFCTVFGVALQRAVECPTMPQSS